ncbi:hypothetical protein AOQ84DRAFT_430292 [Glonium stellatum]|uniref:Vacuolar protein sorting-associated protein 51 homolog n=1 Tax=Glonium stellatum TaxID=574774 RepID=A0A8E2F6T5_9PEZI|nr:hypothetical protein AOQ84DRAFT_430292 [Glonium stellatum]
MTTVASPRPSTSIRSPSSSRTSLDTSANRPTNTRRNRAALRDYYGLKGAAAGSPDPSNGSQAVDAGKQDSDVNELDREGFDAQAYVKDVLSKQGLEGVLRVEAGLVSEIRGLDGERKALVYDNYSKLIAATDTIRKMRTNMDPLAPTTSTLSPAISHIAETAASLSSSLLDKTMPTPNSAPGIMVQDTTGKEDLKQKTSQETVRWALDAPRRLSWLVSNEKMEEAEADWAEVVALLNKWQGVQGVQGLKIQCENIMKNPET